MERRFEIEQLRRSLAMLAPGTPAPLTREQALDLLVELAGVERRLRDLREALRRLADEASGS